MARLALLIDGENIAARYFAEVARYCLTLGSIRSSHVFADFSDGRRSGWLDVCREFGVRPEFQLSRKGKNSVDIAMTIAAMDTMASGAVDTVCLVSSDRDFIPLAQRLRRSGLTVVGIGLLATDQLLTEACDDFRVLHEVAKSQRAEQTSLVSEEERRFLEDLILDLWRTNNSQPIAPAVLGIELKKRRSALSTRIGGDKLMKRLALAGLVTVHGSGPNKTVAPARAS